VRHEWPQYIAAPQPFTAKKMVKTAVFALFFEAEEIPGIFGEIAFQK
jgi:hypothetical protein